MMTTNQKGEGLDTENRIKTKRLTPNAFIV